MNRTMLLLAATAVLAVPAAASATTFDGSCDFAVAVSFDPPLKNTPQTVTQTVRGAGTCTGSFVDRHGRSHALDQAPVGYYSYSEAQNSTCLEGVNNGSGTWAFPYGKLRFAFMERRPVAFPTLEYTGLRGGSAFGNAEPAQDADPVAAAQACAGDGLNGFDVEGRLQTTPSISG